MQCIYRDSTECEVGVCCCEINKIVMYSSFFTAWEVPGQPLAALTGDELRHVLCF